MRPWVEVFAVFIVSHLVGDYMLQTDWQARHKHGALRGTAEMRRALVSHVTTYTLAFVPALVWLWPGLHAGVFGIAALIFFPHLIQDDGELLAAYSRIVKKADLKTNLSLAAALDQSFHILVLFGIALLAGT
ncbi:MAG TPA: DUF3307 domain-containing protein [Solirubrobacteraceae bacterium]|nr:DUF3307 domain-containing protein [Solirubrobacteraceae bacterium]